MKEVLGRPGTDRWWWRDLRCQLIKDQDLVSELESVRARAGAGHLSLLRTFDIMCWMFGESRRPGPGPGGHVITGPWDGTGGDACCRAG